MHRHARQHTAEVAQGRTGMNPAAFHREVADRALVRPAALVHHRDRLTHFAFDFAVAHRDHRVGQVTGVHRRDHRAADQPSMRRDQQRGDPPLTEVTQQFVQLHDQKLLPWHGVEIAVQAVDHHDGDAQVLDGLAEGVREFARAQLVGKNGFDGLAEFHLRRVEHGVLIVGLQAVCGRRQFAHRDPFERPAVGRDHATHLIFAFHERHVQHGLAASHALHQELHRQRGLA